MHTVLPNLLCVLRLHFYDDSIPPSLFPYPSLAKSTWQTLSSQDLESLWCTDTKAFQESGSLKANITLSKINYRWLVWFGVLGGSRFLKLFLNTESQAFWATVAEVQMWIPEGQGSFKCQYIFPLPHQSLPWEYSILWSIFLKTKNKPTLLDQFICNLLYFIGLRAPACLNY